MSLSGVRETHTATNHSVISELSLSITVDERLVVVKARTINPSVSLHLPPPLHRFRLTGIQDGAGPQRDNLSSWWKLYVMEPSTMGCVQFSWYWIFCLPSGILKPFYAIHYKYHHMENVEIEHLDEVIFIQTLLCKMMLIVQFQFIHVWHPALLQSIHHSIQFTLIIQKGSQVFK